MLWMGQVEDYWEHRAVNYLSQVPFRAMKTAAEKRLLGHFVHILRLSLKNPLLLSQIMNF